MPAFATGITHNGSPVRALPQKILPSPVLVIKTLFPSRNVTYGRAKQLSIGRIPSPLAQTSSPVRLSKAYTRSPAGPFAPQLAVIPRVITKSSSITGDAVRPFGNVNRPYSSIIGTFHNSFPSGVNADNIPCVPWV